MSFESRNPATGDLIATYPKHDAAGVEARLSRVWDGWKHWSQTSLAQRRSFLIRLAELLEERADQYGRLITAEMGKPLAEAIGEVKKAASGARHFAEAAETYLQPQPIAGTPARIIHEPLGPIFGIMPWNLPFWQVLRFFIPSALVGNTVLVKHAETVQGSAEALEALVQDAGGPNGLYVNLAIGRERAAAVIADPRIRAVTVTGSVAAGRAVAAEAGRHGKKVVLELGGSDPFIVFDDADLAKAVQFGIVSRFSNNAQSCIAAKRFLVAKPLLEAFTTAFTEQAKALPMGDPSEGSVKLGPLARSDLRDNVDRQVKEAVKAGGRVLTGGEPSPGPGYFYPPTVLVDLPPEAPIALEEFFGPVAMIFSFETEEEAVELANRTEFGLGAAIWSRDLDRANRVASQIEAGAVFINDFVRSDPRAPFGGTKGSGFGRELGALGALELANAKLIWQGG
ncbi:MAG TPA: NAD-dependent succinate-semialdehyde dehydrogenase [Acidisoma sp.]|jgi:succinate-semialdehyde dehydrogenase/glutarate-semialdehyde dehydrogenase/succinate-semialdehyde dehydrogenase|uniref:NAD-dependent succinate-semialdehyde dehydrogenase n=1 Tax=Acidisoma sp. TaxID=1872115 RepID=UPI002CDF70B0|nr:NAD-dependent succinate-semialdehyde dehydrogenase [Acidisoma sp.]HTI00799.1 NAD-dependent succinate-semialdehyde dehydrogenase [Acidisoma sp.]